MNETNTTNDFEAFKAAMFEINKKLYAANANDPEYDPLPTLVCQLEDGKRIINAIAGSPPGEVIPKIVALQNPVMIGTACASFVTTVNVDTQETERGEAMVYTFETPTQSEYWYARVTRHPTTLGEPVRLPQGEGRMTHLLHQHTRNS